MRVVGLLTILLTTPAFAQNAEVKKYLNTAITLYENLEYEKALKQLKSAKAKAKGPDDEARIALLEGVVLADMGREEKALTAFKTAFSVDLVAKLPVEVSPKVSAVAEKARTSSAELVPAAASRRSTVSGNGAGATSPTRLAQPETTIARMPRHILNRLAMSPNCQPVITAKAQYSWPTQIPLPAGAPRIRQQLPCVLGVAFQDRHRTATGMSASLPTLNYP